MTTQKQQVANRKNAKKSTGPKSEAGKTITSQNGLKHGATAKAVILPGENKEDYNALVAALEADFGVSTTIEKAIVENMAQALWKKQRLARYEQDLNKAQEAACLSRSQKPEEDWLELQQSWPSLKSTEEEKQLKLLLDLSPVREELEQPRRYEAMLDRQFYKGLGELEKLQVFLHVKKGTKE